MPSPLCTVNGNPTSMGVNVTAASTVTIDLIDKSVPYWSLLCEGTDEISTTPTITLDVVTKTATFTAGAAGSAYILKSIVGIAGPGTDANGLFNSSYITTLGVYVLTSDGYRVIAAGETLEGNMFIGWADPVNKIVRRGPSPPTGPAGGDAVGSTFPNIVIAPGKITAAKIDPAVLTFGNSLRGTSPNGDLSNNVLLPPDTNVSHISKLTPAATALSQAGQNIEIQCQDATSGTTTASASDGGGLAIKCGDAAQFMSGDADGGGVYIELGEQVGVGLPGQITVTSAATDGNLEPIMSFVHDSGASNTATIYPEGIVALKFFPGHSTMIGDLPFITEGRNSPEGVLSAPKGSMFLRSGVGVVVPSLYVKRSPTGNTGWVAVV